MTVLKQYSFFYRDAPESGQQPKLIIIEEREVNATDDLKIQLASAGGCAIEFISS
ncbi:glycoside hydrolase family 97 C-terminal domain-containing protein [Fodinibius sp. Rm-B-1B1-1]|uniref:glycoside hydrolase family 97 C-terminal domain-containing protein n=1 Tax=Fodinibius alkaliphilus TaxID=3140241 RepID=UPI0038B329CC